MDFPPELSALASIIKTNLELKFGYTKTKTEEIKFSNIIKPAGAGTIEIKTKDKKIIKIVACNKKGTFRVRDPRPLEEKIKEYKKLNKDNDISNQQLKELIKKAIDDEKNPEI